MIISLIIYASPASGHSAQCAYHFCQAALKDGHRIYRLFFYDEGIANSNTFSVAPQDEMDLPAAWAALIQTHELDAVSCVASALKRGVLNAQESGRYERIGSNLNSSIDMSGLGQWVDACLQSDRVVSFGA